MKSIINILVVFLVCMQTFAQDYKNSSNSNDNIGQIHNDILIDLVNKNLPDNLTLNQLLDKVKQIMNSKNEYISILGKDGINMDYKLIENSIDDYKNNFSTVVSNSKMSSQAKIFAQKMIDKTYDSNLQYNDFIQFIKAEEAKFASANISESDKIKLNMAASVARYSAYLWQKKFDLDNNQSESKKSKVRGWIVVGSDIGGFFLGGPAGAGYGSAAAYYITGGFGM